MVFLLTGQNGVYELLESLGCYNSLCRNELIYSGDLAAPGNGQNYFCPECKKNEYWPCQGRLTNWKHVDKDIFERIELFI